MIVYAFILIGFLISFSSCVSTSPNHLLTGWSGEDEAQIVLPFQEPVIIGRVTSKGKTQLQLQKQHGEAVQQIIEEESGESKNIKLVIPTVAEQFVCGDNVLQVEGGTTKLYKGTNNGSFYVVDLASETVFGTIRMASSKEFLQSYYSRGKQDFQKGYFINFYYVENNASVIGTCEQLSYTLDMKDQFTITYDYHINLKEGWNYVKTEILELYTDQNGVQRPLYIKQSTLNKLPENANFQFFNES